MTVPLTRFDRVKAPWVLSFFGVGLGGLLLQLEGHLAYLVALSAAVVVVATWIAADDYRTGLLRNRWTAPFAIAGTIQVVIASIGAHSWTAVSAPCLLGAALTTSLYFLLGLLGWVGFGDVKFAAGLALFVGIPAGWCGLYLLPLALIVSSLAQLLRRAAMKRPRDRSAHGPALAVAAAVLMTAACIGHV